MPTWTSSLAVGVPVIDRQHQELFSRTDTLLAAMRQGSSGPEVTQTLQFLEAYVVEHFSTEERLMKKLGYPMANEHAALHAQFTREFAGLKAKYLEKGSSPTVTLGLQTLVCGWLVKHVGSTDKALAKFAIERGQLAA